MPAPTCPVCHQIAGTVMTRNGPRHSCCGLHSWNWAPLQDPAVHAARRAAHEAFDPIWQQRLTSRSNAYWLLALELGLGEEACHMKIMDEATARRVPAAAEAIRQRLSQPAT